MSGELSRNHAAFRWSGSNFKYLDTPDVISCGHAVIARYGGTTASGAHKNEDAALVWAANHGAWTFAALLDAHGSSESADLVLDRVAECENEVVCLMNEATQSITSPLSDLTRLITERLSDGNFRQQCASVRGETALLLCAQKGEDVWWLSIGDIPVYVFHPDFARLGAVRSQSANVFRVDRAGQHLRAARSLLCDGGAPASHGAKCRFDDDRWIVRMWVAPI